MKLSIVIMTCVALLAGAGISGAAEPDRFPTGREGVPVAGFADNAATRDSLGLKSPGAAFRMSLAGTLVPFLGAVLFTGNTNDENADSPSPAAGVLATGGMVLGPALGYFYGGCTRRGLVGIGIRTGLLAVAAYAASKAEWPTIGVLGPGEEGNAAAGITILAATALAVSAVVDLARVSGTVRRENDRRAYAATMVAPTVRALKSGGVAVGLRVGF